MGGVLSLDCVIPVSGNGTGRGSPRRDVSAAVSDLLTDLTGYYGAVFRHVMACERCDPGEVLRRYVARRDSLRKFRGMTSKGLCELALRYERDPRKDVPRELVDEFFIRSGDLELLVRRDLSPVQEARGLQFLWRRWQLNGGGAASFRRGRERGRLYAAASALARIYNAGDAMPGVDEVAEVVLCAEVMLS